MRHTRRLLWATLLILLAAGPHPAVGAQGPAVAGGAWAQPDYDAPAHFALPWACGQAVRVTWRPEDHWEHGNTRGVAFDFSMVEGTPLYAPASGVAHFRRDARNLPSHLGNYVDIVTDGWLIRLAHLLDEQSGERAVRAGEFVGYSGSSGATAPHLHLEILVRDGERWVAPDLQHLERLYGLPTADLVVDAIIVNDRCAATFALDAAPVLAGWSSSDVVPYGEAVRLLVPLRNEGIESAVVGGVGVTLRGPGGQPYAASVEGVWQFDGKDAATIAVNLRAVEAGTWNIEGVSVSTAAGVEALPTEGSFQVGRPPVSLVGLDVPLHCALGEPFHIEAWLESGSPEAMVLDGLQVSGVTRRGEEWKASAGRPIYLPAGEVRAVTLQGVVMPYTSGEWTAREVSFAVNGARHVLGRVRERFVMDGPDLVIEEVNVRATPGGPQVTLVVTNTGTREAAPDRIVLWRASEQDGNLTLDVDGALLGTLAPGHPRTLSLPPDTPGLEAGDELLDAGYWAGGRYYPIRLLHQAPVSVDTPEEQPVDAF